MKTDVSVPAIQEKLNATMESITHRAGGDQPTRKPRKKADAVRSESLFEATQRAETQRVGNTQGVSLPRKNKRVFDARAEAAPPVMVRGGMGGMAFGRVAASRVNKHKQPKRRIDVPLNVPGAELRLPAIPFIHMGWRAVSLFMVLMMIGSLFLMWKAPVFQVRSVEAVGLKRLTVTDLNAVIGSFGKSVFSLDPRILDKNLHQAFPEFSKISVKVGLPASVKVVVTERIPVIAWTQNGVETWVDGEGISFPARGEPTNPLVRVEGYGTPPSEPLPEQDETQFPIPGAAGVSAANTPVLKLSPELVASILALGAKVPPDTLLVYDSAHGLGWNDPQGWDVFFGPEDQDMEMKLAVYQTLVEKLQSEGIQPALISVEFVHAPYYRMER
jgi:cell division protein FtsQ